MHESFVKLATRLIAANGRDIELLTESESAVGYDDDSDIDDYKVNVVKAVQTKFMADQIISESAGNRGKMFLIDSQIPVDKDMKIKDTDDGVVYSIDYVDVIAPGDTTILYKVRVTR